MKQKIVIKLPMNEQKARSKAMSIASATEGVCSVSVEKEGTELVVIGEEIDSVCLVQSLRKKFCFANILSVEEVKPPPPPQEKEQTPPVCPPPPPPQEKEQTPPVCPPPPCPTTTGSFCPSRPVYYEWAVYDSGPPSCSIS